MTSSFCLVDVIREVFIRTDLDKPNKIRGYKYHFDLQHT